MLFLGKLSMDAIPFHEPIIMVTMAVIALAGRNVHFISVNYAISWVF